MGAAVEAHGLGLDYGALVAPYLREMDDDVT